LDQISTMENNHLIQLSSFFNLILPLENWALVQVYEILLVSIRFYKIADSFFLSSNKLIFTFSHNF